MSNDAVPQPRNDEVLQYGGRDFCAFGFRHKISCVPVDEDEKDRFDVYNDVLERIFLSTVFPNLEAGPREVLDCGFGTGAWISSLLDEHEDYEVTGVDIFDHPGNSDGVQEFYKIKWNMNARFRSAPERDMLKMDTFDLINSRFLSDGIDSERWPELISEYRALLKPGGWLQMVEVNWCFQSDNGARLPHLEAWWNNYSMALRRMNRNPTVAGHLFRLMAEAGFVHIETKDEDNRIPVGDWMAGFRSPGKDNVRAVSELLASFAIMPFTAGLGMSTTRCAQMVRDAQEELLKPNVKIYNRVHVAWGQKPFRKKR